MPLQISPSSNTPELGMANAVAVCHSAQGYLCKLFNFSEDESKTEDACCR